LVAFAGDSGIFATSNQVYDLIHNENPDIFVHLGDMDYVSDPDTFGNIMNSKFGSLPFVVSMGNHDVQTDSTTPTYIEMLRQRMINANMKGCSGKPGLATVCNFNGLLIISSAVGSACRINETTSFIRKSLRRNKRFTWKLCIWHKNQHQMQLGDKPDEVGWEAYEVCRKHGALILTGHNHNYARTHILSHMQNQTIALDQAIKKGQTPLILAGLGGFSFASIYPELVDRPYWAKTLRFEDKNFGALFCRFGINQKGDQDPRSVSCYFKTIDNQIVDQFTYHLATPTN